MVAVALISQRYIISIYLASPNVSHMHYGAATCVVWTTVVGDTSLESMR